MRKNIISAILSIILAFVFSIGVFAATPAAKTEGFWYHKNSSFSSEGSNGSGGDYYTNMMMNHTKMYFVQTKDNEIFEVSNTLYLNKSNGINYLWINSVTTNTNGTWSITTGAPDNTSKATNVNAPNNVGIGSNVVGYTYTSTFTGNGAETKNINWDIDYKAGAISWIASNHKTSSDNEAPAIEIVVSDMRELLNRMGEVEMLLANGDLEEEQWDVLNANLQTILNNCELDGSVYYPQNTIDQLVASLEVPELTKIVPKNYSFALDRDEFLFTGLDADNNSVGAIKAQLKNDSTQIIILRNGIELTDEELVGTNCVIRLVSKADPSIIYEEFTFILYGDVDGDGIINETDYENTFNVSLGFGTLEGLFAVAADTNRDTVIDGFDCAQIDLQSNGMRNIVQ